MNITDFELRILMIMKFDFIIRRLTIMILINEILNPFRFK